MLHCFQYSDGKLDLHNSLLILLLYFNKLTLPASLEKKGKYIISLK